MRRRIQTSIFLVSLWLARLVANGSLQAKCTNFKRFQKTAFFGRFGVSLAFFLCGRYFGNPRIHKNSPDHPQRVKETRQQQVEKKLQTNSIIIGRRRRTTTPKKDDDNNHNKEEQQARPTKKHKDDNPETLNAPNARDMEKNKRGKTEKINKRGDRESNSPALQPLPVQSPHMNPWFRLWMPTTGALRKMSRCQHSRCRRDDNFF